ncbi:unnamed protein product [Dicrocoelium dendriticum]|nr:unnamed protein product [Dicrocoelium dendriticum]
MKCGGLTNARTPTDEERAKLEPLLLDKLESHLGTKPSSAEVVQLSTQVVAGTNYFAKVKVDHDKYVHVRIHEKLPCHGGHLELHAVQPDKAHADPIAYF